MKRTAFLDHAVLITFVLSLFAAGPARADRLEEGIALFNQGRYAEAEAALQAASGTEAEAYRAASLARLKRHPEAEALAGAVLEAQPAHRVAAAALGEALVGQKKHDAAVARLSAVLAKDAGVAYAYYWRGQAYHAKKQIARMVEDYQAFLKLAPDAPEATQVKVLLAGLK